MGAVKSYKHVVWDWNGTLLDDAEIAVDVMNKLLRGRNLPLLDIAKYKDIFTFPVKEYYTRLGFNFSAEPFEKLAVEYISEYYSGNYRLKLHDGVEAVLEGISNLGISQSILSACREQELVETVSKLDISNYFIKIAGLNDHYAISKEERGKRLLKELGVRPDEVLLIGDTDHDYEVSKAMGCGCLLVCNGHQSYNRISRCQTNVVSSISEVIDFLNEEAVA